MRGACVGGLGRSGIQPQHLLTRGRLCDDVTIEEVRFLLTSASFVLLFDMWNRPQSSLSIMEQSGVFQSVCVSDGYGP